MISVGRSSCSAFKLGVSPYLTEQVILCSPHTPALIVFRGALNVIVSFQIA